MSDMPRRTLLLATPAAAAIAAVAAETGIALANVADPYVHLCQDYYATSEACDADGISDEEAESHADRCTEIAKKLIATHATSIGGALGATRVALLQFQNHHMANDDRFFPDRFIVALLESAIAVLEREVRNV